MSLPTVTGRGFLISDGIELKFSKNGAAYARLPLAFKNSRKDPNTGAWTHDREILLDGVVFGKLAESLCEAVDGRTELAITGEIYTEEYEGKTKVRLNVTSAWPVKEAKAKVVAAAPSSDNFPF